MTNRKDAKPLFARKEPRYCISRHVGEVLELGVVSLRVIRIRRGRVDFEVTQGVEFAKKSIASVGKT